MRTRWTLEEVEGDVLAGRGEAGILRKEIGEVKVEEKGL